MHIKSVLSRSDQTIELYVQHMFIVTLLSHEAILHDNDLMFPNATSGITKLFLWSDNSSVQVCLPFPAHSADGEFF